MSAVSQPGPVSLRALRESDLNAVMAIELRGYPFPWTRGIFVDCLRAGYPAWPWSVMASWSAMACSASRPTRPMC
jgi:hypothetical protein